jgi:hypothetical protein
MLVVLILGSPYSGIQAELERREIKDSEIINSAAPSSFLDDLNVLSKEGSLSQDKLK